MMNASNVITHASHGIVAELANDYEVSLRRMYEMLGDQCVYPKAKQLIRAIARHNQDGARLIKADLDAMFAEILDASGEVTTAVLHREASEAVQSFLDEKSLAEKKRELTELIAAAEAMLENIDDSRPSFSVRAFGKAAVSKRRVK